MDFVKYKTGKDDAQRRLDRVLKAIFKGTQTNYQMALRKKLIKVNGQKAQGNDLLKEGDEIEIASFLVKDAPGRAQDEKTTGDVSRDIGETLYRNEHLWIINKKSGICVQNSEGNTQSIASIIQSIPFSSSSLSFIPAPLHRLDRYTSGCLCISQSTEGARWFTEKMESHEIRKSYLAVLAGNLKTAQRWTDTIDIRGGKDEVSFHTVSVSNGGERCKTAITTVQPLAHGSLGTTALTLAQCVIETGVKHQIRAQCSFHGYPLLGDSAYGGKHDGMHTFFLHAVELRFPEDNPLGLPSRVQAPLGEEFKKILESALINWDGQLII